MKKYILISILCWFAVNYNAIGQDAQFSQMETLPIMVNPATTGVFTNNDISLGAQYRNQWSSLSSSINTFALSFDMPLNDKWAVGGFIKNTDEIGIINSFNFMGSGSYIITDPKSKQYIISVGLQIGFIYKRINSGNLTYDEQYDENYFNTDLPTGENYVRQNTIMPDANIGFYYKNINRRHRARPYGGFSVFHVTYPKEQFLDGSEGRLPLRYLGNVGLEYSVNDQIELDLNGYYQMQRDFQQILINLYGDYRFEGSEYRILAGIGYRNKDAVIMHLGFKHGYNIFRFSYDFNISGLKEYTRNRGAIEFSVIYVAGKKQSKNLSRM
jgi:type IX secretion system PorP/SprF family membrane protein